MVFVDSAGLEMNFANEQENRSTVMVSTKHPFG